MDGEEVMIKKQVCNRSLIECKKVISLLFKWRRDADVLPVLKLLSESLSLTQSAAHPSLSYSVHTLVCTDHRVNSSSALLLRPLRRLPALVSCVSIIKTRCHRFLWSVNVRSGRPRLPSLRPTAVSSPLPRWWSISVHQQARCNHSPSAPAEWKPCGLIYCRRHLGRTSQEKDRDAMREWERDGWEWGGGIYS